jgi:hypothetical protein
VQNTLSKGLAILNIVVQHAKLIYGKMPVKYMPNRSIDKKKTPKA